MPKSRAAASKPEPVRSQYSFFAKEGQHSIRSSVVATSEGRARRLMVAELKRNHGMTATAAGLDLLEVSPV